jgi:hypothetical protein
MPSSKKTTSRRTSQKSGEGPITRREVEAATKRFDKALDDAGTALQTMGKNFGRNAKISYRELERALRALRRDAQKANRTVMKDLEKLWAAAGPSSTPSGSRGGTAKRAKSTASKSKSATRSSRSKSSAAKASAGTKSAKAKSSGAKSATAKSSKAAKSSSAKKRAASGSRASRSSS